MKKTKIILIVCLLLIGGAGNIMGQKDTITKKVELKLISITEKKVQEDEY